MSNFKEMFKGTLDEGINDLEQKQADMIEQSWLDTFYDVCKDRMKDAGGFKINVGFGTFSVSSSVKDDNSNIGFEFSKEFKHILEGEDEEIIVEDTEYIEKFDEKLTSFKMKTVIGLSAAMLGMIGEGIAKDCRARISEEKWYTLEIPRLGQIKVGYFDGEAKMNFEADKELKQLVKNYGI